MSAPQDFPLSELRTVCLVFGDRSRPTEHMMHISQVDTFVKATLELHHSPGINPYQYARYLAEGDSETVAHAKARTAQVTEIFVQQYNVHPSRAYWWTTPGLDDRNAQGAHIVKDVQHRVWVHPDVLDKEAAEERAIEHAERLLGL